MMATPASRQLKKSARQSSASTEAMAGAAAAPSIAAAAAALPADEQPSAAATSARVPDRGVQSYRSFVGGAVGGMTAALITSPLEVVKTRLQIRGGR